MDTEIEALAEESRRAIAAARDDRGRDAAFNFYRALMALKMEQREQANGYK